MHCGTALQHVMLVCWFLGGACGDEAMQPASPDAPQPCGLAASGCWADCTSWHTMLCVPACHQPPMALHSQIRRSEKEAASERSIPGLMAALERGEMPAAAQPAGLTVQVGAMWGRVVSMAGRKRLRRLRQEGGAATSTATACGGKVASLLCASE